MITICKESWLNGLEKGDAQLLLEYFKDKQKENASFFYSIQTDESDQISNCFWCDAKSRVDYDIFGDVVFLTQHSKLMDMTCLLYTSPSPRDS